MARYLLRKLAHTAFVAFGVVTLVFVALRASGDPASTMLPGDASVEELTALRQALGLDQSLALQYLRFLAGVVTGDFGSSFRHQQPALGLVLERLPATLELALAALLLAVVIALPLGIVAAVLPAVTPSSGVLFRKIGDRRQPARRKFLIRIPKPVGIPFSDTP